MKTTLFQSSYIVHKKMVLSPFYLRKKNSKQQKNFSPVFEKKFFLPCLIEVNDLKKENSSFLCAFSSGQDSTLTFFILLHFRHVWDLNLKIVSCHHFWQVENFYTIFQLTKLSFLFKIPITLFFTCEKLKNEEQARSWRWKSFFRSSLYLQTPNLVLGHTGSDYIETAIFQLARGTTAKKLPILEQKKITNTDEFHRTNNSLKKKYRKKKNVSRNKNHINHTMIFRRKPILSNVKIYLKNASQTAILWKSDFEKLACFDKNPKNFFIDADSIHIYFHKILTQNQFKKVFQFYFIFRPVASFHRSDISTIVKKNLLPVMIDNTNVKKIFNRNRIRSDILPIIRYFLNKQTETHLIEFFELNTEKEIFLKNIIEKILYQYLKNPDFIKSLIFLPSILQFECIYILLKTDQSRFFNKKSIQYLLKHFIR